MINCINLKYGFFNDIENTNILEIFPKSHNQNEYQRLNSYKSIEDVVNLPKNNINYSGKKLVGNAEFINI